MTDRTYTVAELAEHLRVNEHAILAWIRSGEIRAMNVGRSPGGKKPRWRVTLSALEDFELRRTPTPTPPKAKARRRRDASVIEFF
jgi:excisionase family DNA binding protein